MKPAPSTYTLGEEIASSVTHGIGALLGISALTLLIYRAALVGTAWHIVSAALFGITICLAYTSSTLYHALTPPRAKRLFKIFDHIAIYLLIAGSYTPFTLVTLRPEHPALAWSLFGCVWGGALIGGLAKVFLAGKLRLLSTLCYLAMGWAVLFALKPLVAALPPGGTRLLAAGGIAYTAGVAFYLAKPVRYCHSVWHLFVLAGTVCHFFSVLLYVLTPPAP